MALRAYTPEQREVEHKGQVLGEVRGLALVDFAVLVRTHLPDIDALLDLVDGKVAVDALTTADWMTLAMPIVTQAPGLAANVIALASDTPDGAPVVETWPAGAQVQALIHIAELTFDEVGSVKKALEMVAALLKQKSAKTRTTKPRMAAG